MINLGYACLNTVLREKGIFNSRTMRKKTFEEKGLEYVSSVCLLNAKDLITILYWNLKHNIKLFRISSEMFPWASEYNIYSLPDIEEISKWLELAGSFARKNNIRLSFHPGQFNCLSSEKEHVVENCLKDLNIHGTIFDLMKMDRNHWSKINIHLGSTCGGQRMLAADNFCRNFDRLPESVKTRLTVENDDKPAMFSAKFLYENIYKRVGTPIVFDSHHFELGPQDSSYDEAFHMAFESWGNIVPTCHHSNGKKEYEDPSIRSAAAHSNYYYKPFVNLGKRVDVVLEAKMKEQALFKYKKDFLSTSVV